MGPEDRKVFERIADGLENFQKPRSFLGITFKDLLVAGGVIVAILSFYIRTGDTLERLGKSNEYFTGFVQNSDSYHSASTGTLFYQGKPANPGYDSWRSVKPENSEIRIVPPKTQGV